MDPFSSPITLFTLLCLGFGLAPWLKIKQLLLSCLGLSCAVGLLTSATQYSEGHVGAVAQRLSESPSDLFGIILFAWLFAAVAFFVGALPFAMGGRLFRWILLTATRILAPELHARIRARFPALERRSPRRKRHVRAFPHPAHPHHAHHHLRSHPHPTPHPGPTPSQEPDAPSKETP